MEHKTAIHPQIVQPMLESAANAAEKGQSQFFTPLTLGTTLASVLPPKVRPTIVDLNCGAGHLLQAAALPNTTALLGNDIDPTRPKVEGLVNPQALHRLTCDLTKLYPLLHEINFTADLFVLNPPWRLWWYRNRLQALEHSRLPVVRAAFAQREASSPRMTTADGTIDSTIATLLIALDRCTSAGEGFLIGNNATLERLIFTSDAPHAAIAKHIWGHVVIPGNPISGSATSKWMVGDLTGENFQTGVIYFAASHHAGPQKCHWPQLPDRSHRLGEALNHASFARGGMLEDWLAIKGRLAELDGKAPRHSYNLWLSTGGLIQCQLSRFEEKSVKLNKKEAEKLFKLRDKTPMELVLQRAQRDELLLVVQRGGWRVCPKLVAAVNQAVGDYHGARAPLYPLPPMQRLGYLDEQDTIECKLDLLGIRAGNEPDATSEPSLIFQAGQKYSLRTQTVTVTRRTSKFNPLSGQEEALEHSGQELAIFLSDGLAEVQTKEIKLSEYCFMEEKIKGDPDTQVEVAKKQKYHHASQVAIDFTLQQLAAHFVIPEVPDVATTNPEGYRRNLAVLAELEQVCAALAVLSS